VASYEQRTGYDPVYSEISDYRKTTKRVPKAIDHLNWNARGGNDLLVQMFGPTVAWYEAVSAGANQGWKKVWEGKACR
jgi:hypothetical protein